MIYLKHLATGEIQKFQSINSIGAGYNDWEDITNTTEWHAYEHKLIQKQYIAEALRRRENIIQNGRIQITTQSKELWTLKVDHNTFLQLLGTESFFRLVDGKTHGQFYNWHTERNIIITDKDIKKAITAVEKYASKVGTGGEKNIYMLREEIESKVKKYTTYEAISSNTATNALHNELARFDAIETELMMNEASAPTIEIPIQGDAGVPSNL